MSHTLTQASAPVLASLPFFPSSSNHNTALTPPRPAFLIAIFFIGFSTLQTYTSVSSDPVAQCLLSEVHWIELILAEWKAHLDVISYQNPSSQSTPFPVLWGILPVSPSRQRGRVFHSTGLGQPLIKRRNSHNSHPLRQPSSHRARTGSHLSGLYYLPTIRPPSTTYCPSCTA